MGQKQKNEQKDKPEKAKPAEKVALKKKKKPVKYCKNCGLFGHTATLCNLPRKRITEEFLTDSSTFSFGRINYIHYLGRNCIRIARRANSDIVCHSIWSFWTSNSTSAIAIDLYETLDTFLLRNNGHVVEVEILAKPAADWLSPDSRTRLVRYTGVSPNDSVLAGGSSVRVVVQRWVSNACLTGGDLVLKTNRPWRIEWYEKHSQVGRTVTAYMSRDLSQCRFPHPLETNPGLGFLNIASRYLVVIALYGLFVLFLPVCMILIVLLVPSGDDSEEEAEDDDIFYIGDPGCIEARWYAGSCISLGFFAGFNLFLWWSCFRLKSWEAEKRGLAETNPIFVEKYETCGEQVELESVYHPSEGNPESTRFLSISERMTMGEEILT